MIQKTVRDYLLFNFLFKFPLSFCFTTYVLFLLENGMTMTEVGLINGFFMTAMFALEIPTGVVADFFGRKLSVVFGVFFCGLGNLIYYWSDSFGGYIGAEAVLALGCCLISGALDAWVKDSLEHYEYKGGMGEIFSKGETINQVAIIAGGFLGSLVGADSLRLPWLLSGLGLLGSGLALQRIIKEDYFVRSKKGLMEAYWGMKKITIESIRYGYGHQQVWTLVLISTIFSLAVQPINQQWTPFFREKLGLASVGYVWVGICGAAAIGALLAGRLMRNRCSSRRLLLSAVIIAGLFIFLTSQFENGLLVAGFMIIHEMGRGIYMPAHKEVLQANISSKQRATVSSFESMVNKGGAALGWLGGGYLADSIGTENCWLICAIVFGLTIPLVLKLKR